MLRLYISIVLLYYNAVNSAATTDTEISKLPGKELLSAMNSNLTPAQHIIYIYGPQQWKMQNAINLMDKMANDYLITPGIGAHKFHSRKLTWNKARQACLQEGGHLAIINSNSEEKILLHTLQENKINQAWLGVHDLYEEGNWNTIMDEPLESTGYSKWTKTIANEPDNYGGKQHCGSLMKEGGMDDLECSAALAFFCEINF